MPLPAMSFALRPLAFSGDLPDARGGSVKVRTTAGTGLSSRLTAAGCGFAAILATATITACTTSSPSAALPSPSVALPNASPSVPVPTSSSATGASATPTASSTRTAGATAPSTSASPGASKSPTRSATGSPSASPSTSRLPTAAPSTGGGGTAGFQDTLLLGLGGAAMLAGAGSIAYRRRVIRNR